MDSSLIFLWPKNPQVASEQESQFKWGLDVNELTKSPQHSTLTHNTKILIEGAKPAKDFLENRVELCRFIEVKYNNNF
jgi:hypothetical protein